ncbi:hypothetical protein [Hymenobacter cellulosilyticus]|uniref:Uncharacterized protein n=1 Tax=Hymenobacter cellulosilyticus TaxID=2932248 RepID=A0A8T9QI90_9BACT|nr:hypothetical protein [Hymenobacter cellulosilyticus]UOQ75309.1 hypothetical protein MUN79_29415 [Hymenobacter cellulosilyticus]
MSLGLKLLGDKRRALKADQTAVLVLSAAEAISEGNGYPNGEYIRLYSFRRYNLATSLLSRS